METRCTSDILDVMGDSTSLHDRKSLKQAHNIDGDIRKIVTKNLKTVEQKGVTSKGITTSSNGLWQ